MLLCALNDQRTNGKFSLGQFAFFSKKVDSTQKEKVIQTVTFVNRAKRSILVMKECSLTPFEFASHLPVS